LLADPLGHRSLTVHDEPDFFAFPDLPDEAVIALNNFLEEFYASFQNHYFAQMHRYYHDRPDDNQLPLPIDDPPF
jgi:hypothetical protein